LAHPLQGIFSKLGLYAPVIFMEEKLEPILSDYRKNEGNIITILQGVEETFGYISEEAVNWFSKRLDIPASRFYGIATFYAQFHLKPRGKNVVTVCRGTACHVKGSERLLNRLHIELDIPTGEDTSDDFKFTIEKVNCVGACGIAPVIIVNKEVHGKMSLDKLMKDVKKLRVDE
jgi:NADH:ubiquinone oxidoreductase subunit E